MKKRLEGLQALQSIIYRQQKTLDSGGKKEYNAAVKADPEAVHPVVRVHPVNGRKCLYVSEGYTVKILGLPEDESRDLIAELVAPLHETRVPVPAQLARERSRDVGRLLDAAQGDVRLPGALRRLMHRTTVIGEAASR